MLIFQDEPYEVQIQRAKDLIRNADAVIIGAGAGASTAAGFYPFPTEEAKWGYSSKHALMNRFIPPALPMYLELTYDAEDLFRKMDASRKDCLIPTELVPKCPVCGGRMTMHLRCDNYFVEDEKF